MPAPFFLCALLACLVCAHLSAASILNYASEVPSVPRSTDERNARGQSHGLARAIRKFFVVNWVTVNRGDPVQNIQNIAQRGVAKDKTNGASDAYNSKGKLVAKVQGARPRPKKAHPGPRNTAGQKQRHPSAKKKPSSGETAKRAATAKAVSEASRRRKAKLEFKRKGAALKAKLEARKRKEAAHRAAKRAKKIAAARKAAKAAQLRAAKKAAAMKAAAKKAAAKKAAAKKVAPKKAAVKKAAAKNAEAKTAEAKRAAAKKARRRAPRAVSPVAEKGRRKRVHVALGGKHARHLPKTCYCVRERGAGRGRCYFYAPQVGFRRYCGWRPCRARYVCAEARASRALLCIFRHVTRRVVPAGDGTCRTRKVDAHMYVPYAAASAKQ